MLMFSRGLCDELTCTDWKLLLECPRHSFSCVKGSEMFSDTEIYTASKSVLVVQTVKNLPAIRETQVRSLGWGDPLKKGIAAYSSILAWEIPWAEEAGRLQFMGGRKELDMIEQQF